MASNSSDDDGIEWHEGWHEAHKRYFYFNERTQESVWDKPDAPYVPHVPDDSESEEETEEEDDEDDEEELFEKDESTNEGQSDDEPEWRQGWDESRQLHFYHNVHTGQSVWQKPDEPYVPYDHVEQEEEEEEEEEVRANDAQSNADTNERDMRVEEVLEDAGGESSAPHGTVLRNSRSTDLERARRDHEAAMREYQIIRDKNQMESISTNAKDANGEAGEVPHLVSDPAAPRRARTDEQRSHTQDAPSPQPSVDFCYRFENDAKVRKDKLEKQRRAKEKQIDEMAKGSKRKNNYNPKTLQILKRKGLLNQSSGEVVERLHKWKQTTKNKKQDQADRLSKIDPITGKPLYRHTAWSYTQNKAAPKRPVTRKVKVESKLLSGVEQSPVEERASTTLVDVGDSELIILENAFKRKLRTQAATDSTRMVLPPPKEAPKVALKTMNQRSVSLVHTRIDSDVKLLFELYKDREGILDYHALLNILKGLDIVTEEQSAAPRVEQWLKRLFVLLSHPSASASVSALDVISAQGVGLSKILDFSKAAILGPSVNSLNGNAGISSGALTVDMLAADEERGLASNLHDLYAINTLNRKVRLQDARRKVTTVRRKEMATQKGPAMLPKSREILKLKLQGQQPPAGEPSGTSVGASEISTALLRDESRVEQLRRELEEKERAECTFEPKLVSDQKRIKNSTRSYSNIFHKLHSDHYIMASKPARETTEEKEQKNCTFKPQNFSATYFAQVSASQERGTEADERDGTIVRNSAKSQDKHIHLMQKGRKLHDERRAQQEELDWRNYPEEKQDSPHRVYTPSKVTEVEPFNLRTKYQAEVRSAANYRKQIQEVQEEEMHIRQEKQARSAAKVKSDAVAARGKCLRRYERNRHLAPLLQVEVMVAQGRTENLKVWHLDNADEVADEFAAMHRLPRAAAINLAENLKGHMAQAHMQLVSHKKHDLMQRDSLIQRESLYA